METSMSNEPNPGSWWMLDSVQKVPSKTRRTLSAVDRTPATFV